MEGVGADVHLRDAGERLHDRIGVGNDSAYHAAPLSQAPALQTC